MKIGLITGEYPPKQGGIGDFTHELARALIALGHETQVITGRGTGDGGQDKDIVAHRVIDSWGMRCWNQIAKIAREQHLEVLNIQYEPAAYGMKVGINFLPSGFVRRSIMLPIVTTFHDLLVPYLFPKAGSLRRQVVNYLVRQSDAVIVTNEEDRSNLQFTIPNLHIIPIGSNIDPSRLIDFDAPTTRNRWAVKANELLIGYFGLLGFSKGGEVLIRALKVLIDRNLPVKLMLIGARTGSSDRTNEAYAAHVDRVIESLGLEEHIIETDYLDPLDVSRALMICDVIALPYQDGASLRRGSLLAALAHGRAIVTTTPAYAVQGLIDTQSVLFVPPSDPISLANAIERLLVDRELRNQLEHGAREASKHYTWDRIAAQTIDVYRKVTSDQ
jgi:glycosyltransferase involved in cell wall biosynthesis